MKSNQTKRYIIKGYNEIIDLSKSQKEYSEHCSFLHLISANSTNQAIQRFKSKFDSNFCLNWRFEIYLFETPDNLLGNFYWDFKNSVFCDINPLAPPIITRPLYVWCNGTFCEHENLSEYLTFMSDDYQLMKCPYSIKNVEEWVLNQIKIQNNCS